MTRIRSILCALVGALLLAAPLAAAPAATGGPPSAARPQETRRVTSTAKSGAKPAPAAESASRRLEDVRIEGELRGSTCHFHHRP
jgi:hypothetical protein